jgi:hypothetical protein
MSIDPALVNVTLTLDGVTTVVPRRSDPNDTCEATLCWDYNADGEVEIIGKGCDDISAADSAKVEIVVGCETIVT